MTEKDVKIGIETTVDTSGADKAVEAIDQVGKEADATRAEIGKIDGSGLDRIPDKARPAAGSIDQLGEEVRKLEAELTQLKVGSEAFVTMAGKVKVAQGALNLAQAEATKLGATVGRRGNAGLAVLEFSRAFEDAQYGIRGVLNNIPGLLAQLGAGPGLAGVISVAAVAGTVLWRILSKGSEEATAKATDYLEIYKKIAAEFGNSGLDAENARADSAARNLKSQREALGLQQSIANSALNLEKQRIKGDGGVAAAQARLDLSRIESELLTASGEKAVKLAKAREETLKRTVDLEKQTVELLRQAEERAAEAKVATARESVGAADRTAGDAGERASNKALELNQVADALANTIEQRVKTINTLIDLKADAEKAKGEAFNPVDIIRLGSLVQVSKKLDDALNNPAEAEARLTVRREEAEAISKAANENFAKASEDQKSAAAVLRSAAESLANLRAAQSQDRAAEGQLGGISDQQKQQDKSEVDKSNVVDQLDSLVSGIGESGGKDLAPFIAEMKSILLDKALSADEITRLPVLLSQYFAKIANLGSAQNETVRTAMSRVDELEREVRNLKSTAGSRNP